MRGKSDHVRIEIKDATEGEVRTFIITLMAPKSDFQLADLLRHRKVIEPLNPQLKRTIKDTIASYLSATELLVSALARTSKRTLKHRATEAKTGGGP
jgi:hypothetical protein